MPRYLLSSRTVLDIIQKKGQPGEVWLSQTSKTKGLIARDVCIAAAAPMSIGREIDRRIAAWKAGQSDPDFSLDDLQQMHRNADVLFRDYASDDRIVPMTAPIAARWGDLLDQKIDYIGADGKPYGIGSVQKLEVATAIIGRDHIPYVYVERAQPSLAGINGLVVEDPTLPVP